MRNMPSMWGVEPMKRSGIWAGGASILVAALLGLLSIGAPQAALAQVGEADAQSPAEGDEIFFDEASWRALVEGKTLYYRLPDGLVGREYYPPGGGDRVVFEYAGNGRCFEGSWSATDGLFCFQYDGEHCFRHLKRGDHIYARQMDGVDQKVVQISSEPLSCAKGLTS